VSTNAFALAVRRARNERTLRTRIAQYLQSHGLLITLVCVYALVLIARLTSQISQDSWLELVAGREIARHGIPAHDALTQWTLGKRWIDQQWLAQLLSYWIYRVGGLALLGLVHVASITSAVGLAVRAAGRFGARARTKAWLLVAAAGPIMFTVPNVRTQSFVYPLFVVVLALLVAHARTPSPRVFFVLPLLVLWANLHGSVAVAAALTILCAVCSARRSPLRSLLLALGAASAPFATPWGFAIIGYYHDTLLNPVFKQVVTEWQPTTLQLITVPLYVAAAAMVWIVAQQWRKMSWFEISASLALVALSMTAIRNGVWLGLGMIILLARALDAALGTRELAVRRLNLLLATTVLAAVALGIIRIGAAGERPFERNFPAPAVGVVQRAAADDPRALIFANEHWADWLLFRVPALRGRVAYDARFELLDAKQLVSIYAWRNQLGEKWQRPAARDALIVLDLSSERLTAQVLLHEHLHPLYRDGRIVVLSRTRTSP
jgi:hypothetical protein